MPLMIMRGTSKKDVQGVYSIHEVDYMLNNYIETLKIAQIFQPGGELHHLVDQHIPWGESVVLNGFKFLLKEYKKNNKI